MIFNFHCHRKYLASAIILLALLLNKLGKLKKIVMYTWYHIFMTDLLDPIFFRY